MSATRTNLGAGARVPPLVVKINEREGTAMVVRSPVPPASSREARRRAASLNAENGDAAVHFEAVRPETLAAVRRHTWALHLFARRLSTHHTTEAR